EDDSARRTADRVAGHRHRGDAGRGPGRRGDRPRLVGRRRLSRDQLQPVREQPVVALALRLQPSHRLVEVRAAARVGGRAHVGRAGDGAHHRGETARSAKPARPITGGTTMAKRIEAVGITAYYGSVKAIEDINLVVE